MAKSRIRDMKEKMRESNPDIIQFLETKYIVKDRPNDGPFAVINGVKTEWNIRLRCIIIGIGTPGHFPVLNKLLYNNSFPDIKIETSYGGFIRFCNFDYYHPSSSVECFKRFVTLLEETSSLMSGPPPEPPAYLGPNAPNLGQNDCAQLTKDDIAVLKTLKESPIFNLSLSSRELFHSNFLYWIAGNFPTEFGELFSRYCNQIPQDPEIINVVREKDKIDLSFKYSNGQEVLIENKVKSIPNENQLDRYSENHTANKNYILLSLSRPLFFENNQTYTIGNAMWQFMSYDDLKDILSLLVTQINRDYYKSIIKDYVIFITGLIKITNQCQLDVEDSFMCQLNNENVLKQLKEIRLHDIYIKQKAELLAYKIYKTLLQKKIKGLLNFGEKIDWENKNIEIFTGSNMTNSQALIDLKYKMSDELALVIQIQGGNYRMAVEVPKSKKAIHHAQKLAKAGLWFNFNTSLNINKIYPLNGDFNQFGQTFKYRAVKIDSSISIQNIIDIMIGDIVIIMNNQKAILAKINT